jgi:hypothetical protein
MKIKNENNKAITKKYCAFYRKEPYLIFQIENYKGKKQLG